VLHFVAIVGLAPSFFAGGAPALGAAAAALLTASPLGALVAGALAAMTAIGAAAGDAGAGLVTGVALGLSAASVAQSEDARCRQLGSRVSAVALAALSSSLLLGTLQGGEVLRWAMHLGGETSRLRLPGLGVLLGAEVLVSLCGGLVLAAAALSGSGSDSLATRFGRGSLILGATLGLLSLGLLVMAAAGAGDDVLRSSGPAGFVLVLAAGLLVWGALASLHADIAGPPRHAEPERWMPPATLFTCLMATLLVARASILTEGSFRTPATASMGSAALLALAASLSPRLASVRVLTLAALVLHII